jgi:RimJ/RimL family protein N-acetyltransferase
MTVCEAGATFSATTRSVVTSDGTRFSVRQIEPADRSGLATLFERLSLESRHRRFLSPKPTVSLRELTFLTDIDGYCHDAIAAVDDRDGSIVGTARYVRHADRQNAADVAIEIVDEFHRICLGAALTELTIERARANDVAVLTATTLWDNHGARALLRHHGFRAVGRAGGEIEYELALDPLISAGTEHPHRPHHLRLITNVA